MHAKPRRDQTPIPRNWQDRLAWRPQRRPWVHRAVV